MVTPTTTDDRIATLAKLADSFIYVVSVTGSSPDPMPRAPPVPPPPPPPLLSPPLPPSQDRPSSFWTAARCTLSWC